MNKLLLTAVCLMFTVTLVGCGTIKGIGEEIGTVGGWLVKGSDNVQDQ